MSFLSGFRHIKPIYRLCSHTYPRRVLCCIGDLVEDIVVWPTGEPQRGTDTSSHIYRRRGGSAANVAAFAIRAGGACRFIGQVGSDRLGASLTAELEAAGVDVLISRDGKTGTIVILVEQDGERTMLPDRGAATELDHVSTAALADVAWLHVPAYSLVVEPLGTTTRDLMARAGAMGVPVSVDASSAGLIEVFGVAAFTSQLTALAPDILFCNRDEASLLGVDRNRPFLGAAMTVVKAGPDPVLLIEASGATVEIAVPAVSGVIDTTGAGDAFAAGFLVAVIDGMPAVDAAARGVELAATVLSRPGAATNDQ